MTKGPTYDRRKYPRIRTETLVAVARVDSTDLLGWSLDVSQGGIRFQWVGLEIELGEVLRLTLDLGGHQASAVGKVVRVTALDAFAQEVALAFVEADVRTLELLQDYLEDGGESGGATFNLTEREEADRSMEQTKTTMRRVAGQAERLRSELRKFPLVKRAQDLGERTARRVGQQVANLLDQSPIASRRRVAGIDREIAELTHKLHRLEKDRATTRAHKSPPQDKLRAAAREGGSVKAKSSPSRQRGSKR